MDPKIVEAVVAPAFLILGLSHLLQPQLWIDFFHRVQKTGVAGAIIAMYTLPVGLLLVVGHNTWSWDWPVLMTVAGWGMTIKSALYLIVPQAADRMLAKKVAKSARSFQVAGLVLAIVGGVLTWQSWS